MTTVARARRVSPAELRAEGVRELGCVAGSCMLFVQTDRALHLFHPDAVPDRKLDAYGVARVVQLLERGVTIYEIARMLGYSDHRMIVRDLAATGVIVEHSNRSRAQLELNARRREIAAREAAC